MPHGYVEGNFLIVTSDRLKATTGSRPMHNFVNVGDQSHDVPCTKCKAIYNDDPDLF